VFLLRHFRERRRRDQLIKSLGGIGEGVELDPSVTLNFPQRIVLGEHIYIGPRTELLGRGGLNICSHTIISSDVVIMTSIHRYQGAAMLPYDEVELLRSVTIGIGAWIGMRAIVLPGVVLGDGCVVGAGAVVTKSWEDGSIIAGNPACLIKRRDMSEFRRLAASGQWYLFRKHTEGIVKREQRDSEAWLRSNSGRLRQAG
jgi:maltose O-acetyltransferase